MRASIRYVRILIGLVLLVAALVTVSAERARAQYSVFDADAALQQFHERIESYAALHRKLAPPPAAAASTDPISTRSPSMRISARTKSSRGTRA